MTDPGGTAIYAILDRDGVGVHLQHRTRTTVELESVRYDAYFYLDADIDRLFAEFEARGVSVVFAPCDEEYGMRDFGIETPDGHRLNFGTSR